MVHCCKVERVELICSSSASVKVPPPKVKCCSLQCNKACVGMSCLDLQNGGSMFRRKHAQRVLVALLVQVGQHSLKKLRSVSDTHQVQALDVGVSLYYAQHLLMQSNRL